MSTLASRYLAAALVIRNGGTYRTAAGSVVRVLDVDADPRCAVWCVEVTNPDRDVFVRPADLVAEVRS